MNMTMVGFSANHTLCANYTLFMFIVRIGWCETINNIWFSIVCILHTFIIDINDANYFFSNHQINMIC